MKEGNTFINDNGLMMIILGQDDEHDFIYFCGLCIKVQGKSFQIPFVPIHKDSVQDFVDTGYYIGNGQPSPILNSIEQWIDFNEGTKTFYTIPVQDIWNTVITMLKEISKIEDFNVGSDLEELYVFPNTFPTSQELIDKQVDNKKLIKNENFNKRS